MRLFIWVDIQFAKTFEEVMPQGFLEFAIRVIKNNCANLCTTIFWVVAKGYMARISAHRGKFCDTGR